DTWCIAKFSTAELTDSISSMSTWYTCEAVCYILFVNPASSMPLEEGLYGCRWFTRGLVLQDLLTPKAIMFYNLV
ncbi:hypothetical protein BKA66DRAFT_405106, partial [Pyrenochaeta sp. MPI-SDFR-AT-0127]